MAMLVNLLGAGQAPAASFRGLGFLDDGHSSYPRGISADGSVIVGLSSRSDSIAMHSFRWTAETGMQWRPEIFVNAVSGDGRVLVGEVEGMYEWNAARWTAAEGTLVLDDGPEPLEDSRALGASTDGSVIVGSDFRWTAETGMVDMGYSCYDVSADGSAIVGWPGRWTARTGWVSLVTAPGWTVEPQAISADGSTVVGLAYTGPPGPADPGIAFRWTDETGVVGLGALPGDSESRARDVSGDGSVIVGHSGAGDTRAFIWHQTHGMRDLKEVLTNDFGLDLTGWELSGAGSVSDDGTVIVGSGLNPSGQWEAWRAVIPEPSGLALLMAAVMILLTFVWIRERRVA